MFVKIHELQAASLLVDGGLGNLVNIIIRQMDLTNIFLNGKCCIRTLTFLWALQK